MVAQPNDIEITNQKTETGFLVLVKNNTKALQEVSLSIKGSGFKKIKLPIIKQVKKGETIEFANLVQLPKQNLNFSSSGTSKQITEKKSQEELKLIHDKIK